VGKRHQRIRARSATGQVAGAATESPGSNAHRPRTGLPNMRSPRKPPSRSPDPNQDPDQEQQPSRAIFMPRRAPVWPEQDAASAMPNGSGRDPTRNVDSSDSSGGGASGVCFGTPAPCAKRQYGATPRLTQGPRIAGPTRSRYQDVRRDRSSSPPAVSECAASSHPVEAPIEALGRRTRTSEERTHPAVHRRERPKAVTGR
jgi:hypothetical protein